MTTRRMDSLVRRAAVLAALALALVVAAPATAAPLTFPADPGFTAGTSWTASSACGLLCTATGTQPSTGGNPGAEALASFVTVANVLGTANGSVDFTSASFGWSGDSPASATLHLDRKASLGTLLSINGTAGATIGLVDVTAAQTTTLKTLNYTSSNPAWAGTDVTVPSSLLVAGHTYRLRIHTTFSALVAVLGGASVAYDNVSLAATRTTATVSGTVVGTPTQTGVALGATVDSAGVDATYHVQYGLTTSYGLNTADATLQGADSPGAVGAGLTGLTPGTTYHARLVVTTDAGTTYGPDVTFTTASPSDPTPPVAPNVGAVTATVDGARAASLTAMVDANGLTGTQYEFQFGTTTGYGAQTALTAVPAAGANGWSVLAAALPALTPGTTYHVRAAVRDGNGDWTYGADVTFTTAPAQAPTVGAPSVTAADTGAQVAATITPNSADTDWTVEWGTTTAYGSSSAPVTLPAGADPARAVYDIAGLAPDTDYHFRFVASSQDGTTYGADTVLHTSADPDTTTTVPTVGAAAASSLTPRTAALSGTVDLNGLTGADYRFEYGPTTAYGTTTAIAAVPAAGPDGTSALAAAIAGLTPGGTYHVRVSVRVDGTWTNGADTTFTSDPAVAPAVANAAATVTATTARLTADVTPHSSDVQWRVEYGTTTAYGTSSAPVTLVAANGATHVAYALAGLTAGTTYHFRFVATGPDGTAASADQTLRTDADGATVAEGTDTPSTPADTTTNATAPAATATPVATPASAATTPAAAAVPVACRGVKILARSRGIAITMDNFVTDGAPLAITPRAKAKSITKVTVDGKVVKATIKGRTVRLSAAQLKLGRHTIVVGAGKNAARLTVSAGACASSLAVRAAGGHSRVVLAAVPGTTTAMFALPKAYIKALGTATLSVRSGGRTRTVKIANRAAFTAAAGVKVTRKAASLTVAGLPANVTEVRLTLTTAKRLAAQGVSATVATAKRAARLRARAIGTRAR